VQLSSLHIRNIIIAGRRTTVRLEPVMWEALQDIAADQGRSVHDLVTEIAHTRTVPNLTSAIRVFVVDYYRNLVGDLRRR
jgi:predicted DNA-binding ribbon-helix-helix protein